MVFFRHNIHMLGKLVKEKSAWKKYLEDMLKAGRNPFSILLRKYISSFHKQFKLPYPKDVLSKAKRHVSFCVQRLHRIISSYLIEMRNQMDVHDILLSTLERLYFEKVYTIIFSMVRIGTKSQDEEWDMYVLLFFYFSILVSRKLREQSELELKDLQVPIKYWLTSESVIAVREKEKKRKTTKKKMADMVLSVCFFFNYLFLLSSKLK